MGSLHERELTELISELPDIEKLDFSKFPVMNSNFIFIGILGFEERCLTIPEGLAKGSSHNANKAFYFRYSTNQADNKKNEERLLSALSKISKSVEALNCDVPEFSVEFRAKLNEYNTTGTSLNVVIDISGCSSMPLLLALKVLFEIDVQLHILYAEAGIYHPTPEEWKTARAEYIEEEGFGLAKGVGLVLPSPEHPGSRRDNLPELILAFPTFKPERSKAIIYHVDPSVASNPTDRVIWFIGKPHLSDNAWRMDAIRDINQITDAMRHYFVSTFEYKDALIHLNRAWEENSEKYHITVSPLGSKLQAVGIALFWQMHQEVSMVFAIPKEYNAKQYSEGCSGTWIIPFGSTRNVVNLLQCVGDLEFFDNPQP